MMQPKKEKTKTKTKNKEKEKKKKKQTYFYFPLFVFISFNIVTILGNLKTPTEPCNLPYFFKEDKMYLMSKKSLYSWVVPS